MNIFQNCNFYVTSDLKNKVQIAKSIKDNGGQVSFMVVKGVTHYVSTDKEFQNQGTSIKKAATHNISIVNDQFVLDSLNDGVLKPEAAYKFILVKQTSVFGTSSPLKPSPKQTSDIADDLSDRVYKLKLDTHKPASSSSSTSTSATTTTTSSFSFSTKPVVAATPAVPYSATKPAVVGPRPALTLSKALAPVVVEPAVPTSSSQFALIASPKNVKVTLYSFDSKSQPSFSQNYRIQLSHTLQFTNIAGDSNNNKYYYMELHEAADYSGKNIYRIYTKYGRTDGKPTIEARYPSNLDDALNLYSLIYNEKTSDKKGYKPVSLLTSKMSSLNVSDDGEMEADDISENFTDDSTLDRDIQSLVKFIYKEATTQLRSSCSAYITDKGIQTPLGVLSMDQVEKGEKVLEKIHLELKQNYPLQSKLETLSSEFYTIIPHKMGRGKADVAKSIIKNLDILNEKVELLQLMKDLLKINGSGALVSSAVGMKYQALKNDLEVLKPTSIQYTKITNLLNQSEMMDPNVRILNIYRVNKPSDEQAYTKSIKNTKLLFHGSRPSNFVGLLSRGLLLPKVITNTGGSRSDFGFLGAGIYFADKFSTSLQYSHPSQIDGQQRRLMLVNEVALGTPFQTTKINGSLTTPPTGHHSCIGLGEGGSDFKTNEYVIYNPNQQRQQYLVELTTGSNSSTALGSSSGSYILPSAVINPTIPLTKPTSFTSYNLAKISSATNANSKLKALQQQQPASAYDPNNNNSIYSQSSNSPSRPLTTSRTFDKSANTLPSVLFDDLYGEFDEETSIREAFVKNTSDPRLKQKYAGCEKVFEVSGYHEPSPYVTPLNDYMILQHVHNQMYRGSVGSKIVPSLSKFNENWKKFSNNAFDSTFDWNNLVVAGGAILGCTLSNSQGFDSSDIDIFLYGLTEQESTEKLRSLHEYFKRKFPKMGVVRTKFAVTFLNEYPNRNIQVVLRLYQSPAQVLMGFDIDCCSVGYDGQNVYSLPRTRRAIVNGYNVVSMNRRSFTYETRLFKYAKRGFAVVVPGFDRSRVHPDIYTTPVNRARGLARLLLLEYHFARSPKGEVNLDNKSDYSECEVPWGQMWTVDTAVSVINYRDRSQFFAKKNTPNAFEQHRHIAITGFDHCMDGKSSWCKKCQANEPGDDVTGKSSYVTGPITWHVESQGRQLSIGSFHPIENEYWLETAYKNFNKDEVYSNMVKYRNSAINNEPVALATNTTAINYNPKRNKDIPFIAESNHLVAIAAAYGNLDSLKSLLPVFPSLVNVPTDSGYYPIHYACMGGNLEVVKFLFANGAHPHLRSKNNIKVSCLVVARYYNHQAIVAYLSTTFAFLRRLKSAILNGDVTELARHMRDPKVPSVDLLGQTLYHYAVFSSAPEKVFKCIRDNRPATSYESDKRALNAYGQSVHHYIKMALGSLEPLAFVKTHGSSSLVPPSYRKELLNLLSQFPEHNFGSNNTALLGGLSFFSSPSKSSSGSSTPPSPPKSPVSKPASAFGSGGKFDANETVFNFANLTLRDSSTAAPKKRIVNESQAAKPAVTGGFSFGAPSSSSFPPNPPFPALSMPVSFTQPQPDYSASFPAFLSQQPVSYSDRQSDFVTPGHPRFDGASSVAKAIALVDQLKTTGKVDQFKSAKLKTMAFQYSPLLFNCIEAYLLDSNIDNLAESFDVLLSLNNN
ncbi:poly(ADP-ribosyl)transferase [Cavenderia fasciculata]|uniref:Poly [ADP-ribose] polymerase n=1 Tax=Cavenderia fasciculata TaxID=261658 RepID=F4PVU3_CACFS|nr:poly(ADP-ribosyl)transferase [Cavenderia fasciculata]EGG20107.1 poly(ADP-ribosyl)transferase [Cavenderia fasciculata]|eukprot:XP_004367090.1 poly(ADP-ribosyl)transferase [Cavenderia fasciculata]